MSTLPGIRSDEILGGWLAGWIKCDQIYLVSKLFSYGIRVYNAQHVYIFFIVDCKLKWLLKPLNLKIQGTCPQCPKALA